MIDEYFLKKREGRHKVNYIVFSALMAFIGFFTCILLFGPSSSLAQLLVITILLTPIVIKLFKEEEFTIREKGVRHIFQNHKKVFEIFLMIFIGIFVAYLIIQLFAIQTEKFYGEAFQYQIKFIESYEEFTYSFTDFLLGKGGEISFIPFLVKNVLIMMVAFLFSFFYGAGGVFLIVTSGTLFSTIILFAYRSSDFPIFSYSLTIFFLLLLFPLILTSIAGGIASRAFVHEKIRSKYFKRVIYDSLSLFAISIGFTILLSCLWYGILRILIIFI